MLTILPQNLDSTNKGDANGFMFIYHMKKETRKGTNRSQ